MSAILEASVILSITGALVVSLNTGMFIDLTTVHISAADAQVTGGTNNSTPIHSLVSQEERQQYLDELQSESTRIMTPALVFLAVVAVCGIVGNTVVIVVYARKLHLKETGVLIITIAGHDLVANIIAIPAEIYDMLHLWDFESSILCTGRLYVTVFTTISASTILVAVAVTRYRKVCRPHEWQITTRNAKVISISSCCLAAVFSTPYVIVMGIQKKKTPRSDIVGCECATKEDYVNTIFPLVIYLFYLFLHVASSVILTVLYILIGVKAWKHRSTRGLTPVASRLNELYGTTSRYDSSTKVDFLNQNESNCRSCRSPYNKNMDTSFTGEIAIQSARYIDDIKMKRFLLVNEDNDGPVQYNDRIFTDRIVVRTPAVDAFFVNLHKTKPGHAEPVSHGNCHPNNTDNGHRIKKGYSSGGDNETSVVRKIGISNSNIKMRSIKLNRRYIDSHGKYTERRADEFLNRENKLDANKTKDVTVKNFHSKELSVMTGSIYDTHFLNFNVVDNNRHARHSIESAANEILSESDPSLMFKWFEIIYFPDDEHTTFDSNFVKRETSLAFRLPINNSRLQQTEWLRASVNKYLERPNDMIEHKSGRSGRWEGSSVDFISSLPSSGQFNDSSIHDSKKEQLKKNLLGIRLRRAVVRKWSILTVISQHSTTFRRPVSRTTVMLFIISAFYIFGYVPHLAIKIISFLSPGVFENMSMTKRSLHGFLMRTFFINCAVNPFVYSLCDGNFRRECYNLLKC